MLFALLFLCLELDLPERILIGLNINQVPKVFNHKNIGSVQDHLVIFYFVKVCFFWIFILGDDVPIKVNYRRIFIPWFCLLLKYQVFDESKHALHFVETESPSYKEVHGQVIDKLIAAFVNITTEEIFTDGFKFLLVLKILSKLSPLEFVEILSPFLRL